MFAVVVEDADQDERLYFTIGGPDATNFQISSTGIIFAKNRMVYFNFPILLIFCKTFNKFSWYDVVIFQDCLKSRFFA